MDGDLINYTNVKGETTIIPRGDAEKHWKKDTEAKYHYVILKNGQMLYSENPNYKKKPRKTIKKRK